jgi:hypothetical protein
MELMFHVKSLMEERVFAEALSLLPFLCCAKTDAALSFFVFFCGHKNGLRLQKIWHFLSFLLFFSPLFSSF